MISWVTIIDMIDSIDLIDMTDLIGMIGAIVVVLTAIVMMIIGTIAEALVIGPDLVHTETTDAARFVEFLDNNS